MSMPIAYRRIRGDVIETYKIVSGKYNIDTVQYTNNACIFRTRGLEKVRFKHDLCRPKYCFTNRVVYGTVCQIVFLQLRGLAHLKQDLIHSGKRCYLLHTFCLPILLYGLEAVAMSNANLRTLYVTWKTAL